MPASTAEIIVNPFQDTAPGMPTRSANDESIAVETIGNRIREWTDLSVVTVTSVGAMPIDEARDLAWIPPCDCDAVEGECLEPTVLECKDGCVVLFQPPGHASRLATFLPALDSAPSVGAIQAAAQQEWPQSRLDSWWREQADRSVSEVVRQLTMACKLLVAADEKSRSEWEIESLADQIDSTYEEISLLHYLAQNLQVSRETSELGKLCLKRLRESIRCESAAIWLVGSAEAADFHTDGHFPLDELELAMLIAKVDKRDWSQPLVRNHIPKTTDVVFNAIESLIVAPILNAEARVGWVVAVNPTGGREFGSVEASLLQSVAVNLGTHLQNAAVMAEREELMLSFVRALVSSLDAKDQYTRGHSERVAMIARRIGIELGLPDQDVEDIYLAGLLHDVGKIGVDDAILRKPGRLTDEEFADIQRHPEIGYHILGGIKKLKHILPGVRNHHESFDGSGYPDGLAGYEISMMARVLAVADSFDAMGSDRPYRKGMPIEKLEGILREGRGTQWDPEIVDAYFACRGDIREICLDWTARQVR